MSSSLISDYPELAAFAVALAGFAVASLVSNWFNRVLNLMDSSVRRISPQRADQLATITPRAVLQRIIYYMTLIFFMLLAIRILGITALTDWLDLLLAYIPQILLGGIIIVVGYLLGILTHTVVANLVHATHGPLLPRLAQIVVVVTSVMTGLEQMEIDVSFITNVIIILMGATLGGLSIAFAIGSRDLVANLLAFRSAARFQIGDNISVNGVEGKIIEFTRTSVVLECSQGLVTIPATRFLDTNVTLIKT